MKVMVMRLLLFVSIFLVGCSQFRLYSDDNSAVVASVGGVELHSAELEHIYGVAMSSADSLAVRQAYINAWVRAEVKRQAAERELEQSGSGVSEIDRMVKEYRAELLKYKFERDFIDRRVDTTVTEAQVDAYYKDNASSFKLAGPLVKAIVVRLPAGLRQSKRLEEMFKSPTGDSREEFLNICNKNSYRVDDYTVSWIDFSVVLRHIPFSQVDFDNFLKSKRYYEVADDQYKYMMRIEDYLLTGSLSPRERERDNIVKILRNLRRGDLVLALEDSLMRDARSSDLVHIMEL